MRKLISLLLALVMIMSFATVAFAEEKLESNLVDNKVTMTKNYTVVGSTAVRPTETFTFSDVTAVSVIKAAEGVTKDNMPMISVAPVTIQSGNATTTGTVEITVPGVSSNPNVVKAPTEGRFTEYPSVGVYTYIFYEIDGGTEGVTYGGGTAEKPMTVVVTVVMGDNGLLRIGAVHCENPAVPSYEGSGKTSQFTNTYSAGTLTVSKTVSGAYGDQSKYFTVKVKFEAGEGDTVKSEITYAGGKYTDQKIEADKGWNEIEIELEVKHGDTITFENIPYGVTYTVTETATEEYVEKVTHNTAKQADGNTATCTIDSADGCVTAATVAFENNREGDIDTGIELDSIPFVVMMVVCAAAAVLFVIKRRSVEF